MTSRNTKQLQKRTRTSGAAIAEFAVCLMIVLLAMIPVCNVAVFGVTYCTLQIAMQEVAEQVAMSESRAEAIKSAEAIYLRMQNPIWSSLHVVTGGKSKRSEGGKNIVTAQVIATNQTDSFSITSQLPEKFRPSYKRNRSEKRYAMSLDTPCEIQPMFNLAGFPLLGQIPIVGAAVTLKLHAEAPVEYLESLDY